MTALAAEVDENLEHVRAQLLNDVAEALRLLDRAAGHADALRLVDRDFDSRAGRDVGTFIDDARRSARASYAGMHLIADRERL